MTTAMPALSALITVYNGERYLAEAIQSLRDQTFGNHEIIVVDDGSTDDTASIIERCAAVDPRIRFEKLERVGRVRALNAGCRLARGRFVAILDADDVAMPARFAAQMDFLERNPRVALLGAGVCKISDGGRLSATVRFPLGDQEIKRRLTSEGCFAHSAVVMAREALFAVGGYREAFPPAEDYDLWLRMAERYEVANLPEALVYYRVHASQVSTAEIEQHALAVLGARLAARRRGEMKPDPADGVERVTADLLETNGIDRAEIHRQVVEEFVAAAITLWTCEARDECVETLHRALQWSRRAGCDDALRARLHLLLSSRYFRRRQPFKGFASLLRAHRDDSTQPKALIERWLGRLGRREVP